MKRWVVRPSTHSSFGERLQRRKGERPSRSLTPWAGGVCLRITQDKREGLKKMEAVKEAGRIWSLIHHSYD